MISALSKLPPSAELTGRHDWPTGGLCLSMYVLGCGSSQERLQVSYCLGLYDNRTAIVGAQEPAP